MARINALGNIIARCPGCNGSTSTYEWKTVSKAHGHIGLAGLFEMKDGRGAAAEHRLYRCAGCGRGGLALIYCRDASFPSGRFELHDFHQEVGEVLALPPDTPAGIEAEFREAERCLSNACYRAAAGMFRSVLDKTLRANGYKLKLGTSLQQQIDMAADDGIITAARQRRAHDEIRVLGNDVLHEEWKAIPPEDVEAAHHYIQRILEDFYDDRPSTLAVLRAKGRVPDEDKPAAST